MPANLVWGKGFRTEETTTPLGKAYEHVVGIDGGLEMISWSSVGEIEALAERYGVSRQIWPIYRGCEIETEVPLEDAERRSAQLRTALKEVDPGVLEQDYWLRIIWKFLCDGNAFFIMS